MKKIVSFLASALSAVTLLTSCLGEGTNTQSFTTCGVYFTNTAASNLPMLDVGSAYVYIPSLISEGYSENACLGVGITIDYNSEENLDWSSKGYLTASLTTSAVVIDQWRSTPIVSTTDTTTLKTDEIALNYGFTSTGYYNYARGYLFFTSGARISSQQDVTWYLSYPSDLEPVIENGSERHYQFFVRATAEGDNTNASNQDVNNAYYVKDVFEAINQKEAADNQQYFYIDFNYVRAIDEETNTPVWSTTTAMYAVSTE